MYKTEWMSKNDVNRSWYLVDAKDQILGRVATRIAKLLIGKDKPTYSPNLDAGDAVIVINSADVKLTRGKELKKMYYSHSGYMGGLKETRFDAMMKKDPTYAITKAVENMLPNDKLRADRMARLRVFADASHGMEAQKPVEYKF